MADPATIKFKKQTDKRPLTKMTIERLKPPPLRNGKPTQEWIYDSRTPRLAICNWSTGSKVWYWIGRIGGRMARIKLGAFPEMTPENARKAAQRTSVDVADGIDPRHGKRRGEWTLGVLFDTYIEQKPNVNKKPVSYAEDEKQFGRYLTKFRSRPLSTINRATITDLHSRLGRKHGHYAANRLLALLSMLFNYAIEIDAIDGANPCKGVRRYREQERDRFLDAAEIKRLHAALDYEDELFRDFFRMLLYTGARRSNVMAMRFEDIDFDGAVWRIPTTKNSDPLRVPLVDNAVEILRRRRESVEGEWVFPARRGKTPHLSEPKTAWERIRKRANLRDVRIHDLRRTLGSWQAAGGASLPIIGKSLGHRNPKTTAIYARLDIDPVRASVNAAVAAMTAEEGKEDP